jgi:hypothetical protein
MTIVWILVEIALFAVGLAVTIWALSNTVLPIVYGFPRALLWAMRGFARVRGAFLYLVAPVVWIVGIFALGVGLALFAPRVLAVLRDSVGFNLGQIFGTVVFVGQMVFSRSIHRDATLDFLAFMKGNLTPAGYTYAASVFDKANRIPNHP